MCTTVDQLVALMTAVSNYLECNCCGRVVVVNLVMVVAAADSKDQRLGPEPDSQRTNLQVCIATGMHACGGGAKTQQSHSHRCLQGYSIP
jgi:hypothetical protein